MPTSSCKSPSPRMQRMPRAPRAAGAPRSPLDTRSRSPLLREFLLHLASERGLAENTLLAYRRDLEDIERQLARGKITLDSASADDFRSYLQDQSRRGRSTRTIARRLAALRSFLRWLGGER